MIGLINSNALHIPLADKSVQCVITSPPYYGLRDYGTSDQLGLEKMPDCLGWATGDPCGECYVCHVVQWAREVKRVLRDDGVFWLNLGDSYISNPGDRNKVGGIEGKASRAKKDAGKCMSINKHNIVGLKPKDLILIPARVALALQADGWYVRNDVIWNKLNPMPESVKDRCTKSHEYVFMLTKSAKYYYDNVAILEPAAYDGRKDTKYKGGNKDMAGGAHERWPARIRGFTTKEQIEDMQHHGSNIISTYGLSGSGFNGHSGNYDSEGNLLTYQDSNGLPARNKRDVWTIATSPFKGAHYAVFPPKLVEPMILASTSEKGCCPKCGKPWERIVEKEKHPADEDKIKRMEAKGIPRYTGNLWADEKRHTKILSEYWRPGCACLELSCDNCGIVVEYIHGTKHYMRTMRNRISLQKDTPEILQSKLLSNSIEDIDGQSLHPMRNRISPDESSSITLREKLCNKNSGSITTKYKGLVQDNEGVYIDISTESPGCKQIGIYNGTSPCNGENIRQTTSKIRDCASYKRKEIRQSPGEFSVDEKRITRQLQETDLYGDLSILQSYISNTGECPHCRNKLSLKIPQPKPCIIFDPFAGSGTTLLVARNLGRSAIGCDLSYSYLHEQARKRLELDKLKFI